MLGFSFVYEMAIIMGVIVDESVLLLLKDNGIFVRSSLLLFHYSFLFSFFLVFRVLDRYFLFI